MSFTDDHIDAMLRILKRIDPGMIQSLQLFTPENEFRTGCPIVIKNKYGKVIYLFQHFDTLSPYRMKLLMRLSGQIPFLIHITNPREGLQRIGWKFTA
jgi:hypothetical protein